MSLFLDAVLVTLGILAAVCGAIMLTKAIKFAVTFPMEYAKAKRRQQFRTAQKERAMAEKAKLVQEAQDFVNRNSEIVQLVEALEATPYSSGSLTADKQQNKKRGKIQNELRKLVPNDRYRKVIYEMTK